MNKKIRGFSLIEVLVVVFIIGLLATISLISLKQGRQNARNTKRMADVRQMQTALELYFNRHQFYPSSLSEFLSSEYQSYMEVIPEAPMPNDGNCSEADNQYTYTPAGNVTDLGWSSYTIDFCLGSSVNALPAGKKRAVPGGIFHLED